MSAAALTTACSTCRLPITGPQRRVIAACAASNEPRTASTAASRARAQDGRQAGSGRPAPPGPPAGPGDLAAAAAAPPGPLSEQILQLARGQPGRPAPFQLRDQRSEHVHRGREGTGIRDLGIRFHRALLPPGFVLGRTCEPRKKSPPSPRFYRFPRTAAVPRGQPEQPRPGLLGQPAPLCQPLQLPPQGLHLPPVRAQPGRRRDLRRPQGRPASSATSSRSR